MVNHEVFAGDYFDISTTTKDVEMVEISREFKWLYNQMILQNALGSGCVKQF